MVIATRVIQEKFKLKRTDVTTETDIAISSGEGMQDIWKYKVPVGHTLVFSPSDTFAAYLEDSTSTECVAGTLIAAEVRDASEQHYIKPLLNTLRYAQAKSFQDRDKLVRLDIEPGKQIVAREGDVVVIKGNPLTVTLDASDSYFELTCNRIRKSLFG